MALIVQNEVGTDRIEVADGRGRPLSSLSKKEALELIEKLTEHIEDPALIWQHRPSWLTGEHGIVAYDRYGNRYSVFADYGEWLASYNVKSTNHSEVERYKSYHAAKRYCENSAARHHFAQVRREEENRKRNCAIA